MVCHRIVNIVLCALHLLLLFSHEVMSNSLWPHISRSLLKFMSIESVMLSNHFILCRPPSPFAFNESFSMNQLFIGGQNIAASARNSPSSEHSGLISFRIDWFDLLAPRDSQESSPAPQFKSINFFLIIYYFFIFGYAESWCFAWTFSNCSDQGLLFIAVLGLLTVVASLAAEHLGFISCSTHAQ